MSQEKTNDVPAACQQVSELQLFEQLVKEGNCSKIKKLITSGFYVNQILTELPPLSLALTCGNCEIVELLISSGADVCQMDINGKHCPMFYAIKTKCPVGIIKRLISAGFPKNGIIEYNFDSTALHLAVYSNHKPIIKSLLGFSVDVNSRDVNGLTPLHVAVQWNHPKIIKLLVHNGADIDAECKDSFTPLMFAIHDDNPALVALLISLGSNVNHEPTEPKYSYQKPLNYAAGLGHISILQILLSKGADVKSATVAGDSALHSVTFSDKITNKSLVQNIVQILVEHGNDLECVNNLGQTPLHSAIIMRNILVTKALIKAGSRVTSVTPCGNHPLHIAAKVGDAESVGLLLRSGADVDVANADGLTPYDEALKQTDTNTVRAFWRHGYPYDKTKVTMTQEGSIEEINNTMLWHLDQQKQFLLGIETGNLALVNEALKYGAEPRGCGLKIRYPLHFAVAQGFEEIVSVLLKRGVPAGSPDKNGETPLHVAAKTGQEQICKLLLAHGACFNYFNAASPKTPFQLAKRHEKTDVEQLLSEVYRLFINLKNGNSRKVVEMLNFPKDNMVQSALLNCVDKNGLTLMATAIENKDTEMAEFIMLTRLIL